MIHNYNVKYANTCKRNIFPTKIIAQQTKSKRSAEPSENWTLHKEEAKTYNLQGQYIKPNVGGQKGRNNSINVTKYLKLSRQHKIFSGMITNIQYQMGKI